MLSNDAKIKLIEELQKKINSTEYCPRRGYRRDVSVYELVSYINNITGCFISRNIKPIPLFIERARSYMSENTKNELNNYYQLVSLYLDAIEEYISTLE